MSTKVIFRTLATCSLFASALVTSAASAGSSVSTAVPPGWTRVPGAIVRQDCVYMLPSGANIDHAGNLSINGAVVTHVNPCPEAPIKTRPPGSSGRPADGGLAPADPGTGGWVMSIEGELSGGLGASEIQGEWKVPPLPPSDQQTLYFWDGVESDNLAAILQPVLAYGANSCGYWWTGSGWQANCVSNFNSWFITSVYGDVYGNFYYSGAEEVSPGDTIYGQTWQTGALNPNGSPYPYSPWEAVTWDLNSNAFTWITTNVAQPGEDPMGFLDGIVLEAYFWNLNCSDYPASNVFNFSSISAEYEYGSDFTFPEGQFAPIQWYNTDYYDGPSCNFGIGYTQGSGFGDFTWQNID
jgi:hypothetical protein